MTGAGNWLIIRGQRGTDWAAEGVFTLFAILFFLVGAQLFALGLIGESIGRIYREVRKRPRYLVRRVYGEKDQDLNTKAQRHY